VDETTSIIPDFTRKTLEHFKALHNPRISEKIILCEEHYGGNRISLTIDTGHIRYINEISKCEIRETFAFDSELIARWKLLNKLLTQPYIINGSLGPNIDIKYTQPLATLVAFPLIEEIALKWTQMWDISGRLKHDIPASAELKDKNGNPKIYKAKSGTISSFSHKMNILIQHIDAKHVHFLAGFDKATQSPGIDGLAEPIEYRPMFDRLSGERNAWAHGSHFRIEGPFMISMLVSFFYSASMFPKRTPPWRS
jgi:hypothetical protein